MPIATDMKAKLRSRELMATASDSCTTDPGGR